MTRYFITGASRGIGRAIAEKLAQPETTLLLHGRDRKALTETCRRIEAINNAGIAVVKPFDSISLEEWERTLAVNVTAPFLLTQKLTAKMKAGSSVVNILSIAAKTGFPNWSSYCMSKFALEGLS